MNLALDGIVGLIVGDALGVPVEFTSREYLEQKPVTNMIGYGTYNQPPGTWSDDSSLTLCLTKSLLKGYKLENIAQYIVDWREKSFWCPHNAVFDIGNQTNKAIDNLKCIFQKQELEQLNYIRDNSNERTNGNGSLMRILPLYFYIKNLSLPEQFEIIWDVSALTHPHILSAMACFFYLRFISHLENEEKIQAFKNTKKEVKSFFKENKDINENEILKFKKLFSKGFKKTKKNNIESDGYVINSLEASIWCFLTTQNYSEAVLKAVNLGTDTDTTAAITGGMAGLFYGIDSIPKSWINILARKDEIFNLCKKFEKIYIKK